MCVFVITKFASNIIIKNKYLFHFSDGEPIYLDPVEDDLPGHEEVLDASGDPLCVYGDVSSLGNDIYIESVPGPSR